MNYRILFFKMSLFLFVLTKICRISQIAIELLPYTFFSIFEFIASLFAIFSILANKRRNFIVFKFLLVVLSIYVYYKTGEHLFPIILLIVAGENIEFEKVLSWMLKPMVIGLTIPWVLSSVNIITNNVFTKELPLGFLSYTFRPQGLGFMYFSGFSYLAMAILMAHAYLKSKISFKYFLLQIGLSVCIFLLTVTRLQLIINFLFIIFLYAGQYIPPKIQFNKLVRFLSLFAFPLCLSITLAITFSPMFSDYQNEIKEYSAGRNVLNLLAFERYQISIFGNKIETADGIKSDYFFIDSGYVYSILGYGILLTVLVISISSVIGYRSFQVRNWKLLIWVMLFAVANISNNFLFSIINCPFLMLAFSSFTTTKNKIEWKKFYQ